MKQNVGFFTVVILLLFLSSLVLAGCMYAIAADLGDTKPYDRNEQKEIDGNGGMAQDPPLAQESLQAKFEAMYDISEDGKTITVISQEYLQNYWQSNYEKEVIHSLTTEEVYFIIQDSIRIYKEYDEVILSGFASYSSDSRIAFRMPFVKDQVIFAKPKDGLYYFRDDITAIYEIILYRLKALSSPKAFFTGAEAIRFAGGDPLSYSSMYPETLFYIPGYAASTDRDHILSIMGGNTDPSDLERFSDLFVFPAYGMPVIELSSPTSGTTQAYPTAEMEKQAYPPFSVNIPELKNALIEIRDDSKVYVDGEYLCGGPGNGCRDFYWNDITGDGKPELCFVMSSGSGMIDFRIAIYDYETRACIFSLSDRGYHDYGLFVRDGILCVSEREYLGLDLTRTGMLIYDGSKVSVSWDAEVNCPVSLPTGIPIDPPINNNEKNEYEMPYFKLDLAGNICALMSRDGNPYADGTYVHEGDAYILSFDGDYRYVFYYNEGVGYEYAKGESNPIQGYELEDMTVFALDDYILTAVKD